MSKIPGIISLMRSMICLCVLLIFLSNGLAHQKQASTSNRTPIKIGIIKDNSFYGSDAGCALRLASDERKHNERFVFLSDDYDKGLININGKDIKLKWRTPKSVGKTDDELKVGSKSTEIFDGPGLTVKVDFIATWVCPPDDEGCEITKYDATVTVLRDKNKKTIITKGLCGS